MVANWACRAGSEWCALEEQQQGTGPTPKGTAMRSGHGGRGHRMGDHRREGGVGRGGARAERAGRARREGGVGRGGAWRERAGRAQACLGKRGAVRRLPGYRSSSAASDPCAGQSASRPERKGAGVSARQPGRAGAGRTSAVGRRAGRSPRSVRAPAVAECGVPPPKSSPTTCTRDMRTQLTPTPPSHPPPPPTPPHPPVPTHPSSICSTAASSAMEGGRCIMPPTRSTTLCSCR